MTAIGFALVRGLWSFQVRMRRAEARRGCVSKAFSSTRPFKVHLRRQRDPSLGSSRRNLGFD